MTEQLNEKELEEEKGTKADRKTVEELTDEISSSWNFKEEPPAKPVLLFLGGFQGSGKTTTLELIRNELDLAIISSDEIRYKLFERGWKISEEFRHTISATRNNLIRRALSTGHHVAIDQRTTPQRIELVKEIANQEDKGYKPIFAYLDSPHEVLKQRMGTRQPFPGRHQGTLEELMEDINNSGYPDYGLYDLVIDSSKINPQAIANQLKSCFPKT